MNVLVVSQYFWPENFRINDLVKSLRDKGLHIDVLTGQPNYPSGKVFDGYRAWKLERHNWNNGTIYRLPLIPRGRGSAIRLILNYLSFVVSGVLLAPWILRNKRVDITFVYAISPILQAIPAITLKWLKGAKVVIWVQDLWPESLEATGFVRNRWLLGIVKLVVRWIYRQADLILVQSEAFIDEVAALAEKSKICYYPNSADDIFSAGLPGDCAIHGLSNGFSVVFAGNLGTAQAVETILSAAILLKDVQGITIYLVGDGSRAGWIREQITLHALTNVIMAGRYPLESMPGILGSAGALLATLRDEPIFYHTVPSKIQSYLAVGRPIIACMNGEGARIVKEANAGVSCAAEDAGALAAAIKALSSLSPVEREQLGKNGLGYFLRNYDSNILTLALISHFDNLIRSPSK